MYDIMHAQSYSALDPLLLEAGIRSVLNSQCQLYSVIEIIFGDDQKKNIVKCTKTAFLCCSASW
jgi:hypothetical protein